MGSQSRTRLSDLHFTSHGHTRACGHVHACVLTDTHTHTCRPCMCVFHLSRKQKAKCEEPRAELTLQVGVCGAGSERAGEAERSGHPASAEHLCTASYSLREQSAEFLLSALPFLPLPYLCQVRSFSTLLRPHHSAPCCSVSKLCPVLYDSVDCSTPGFPVLHQLPESAQTHVHSISDAIQPAHPLSPLSPPALNLFLSQGLFQ